MIGNFQWQCLNTAQNTQLMINCMVNAHNDQQFCAVCIEKQCSKRGLVCFKCILNHHHEHVKSCVPIQEFIAQIQKGFINGELSNEIQNMIQKDSDIEIQKQQIHDLIGKLKIETHEQIYKKKKEIVHVKKELSRCLGAYYDSLIREIDEIKPDFNEFENQKGLIQYKIIYSPEKFNLNKRSGSRKNSKRSHKRSRSKNRRKDRKRRHKSKDEKKVKELNLENSKQEDQNNLIIIEDQKIENEVKIKIEDQQNNEQTLDNNKIVQNDVKQEEDKEQKDKQKKSLSKSQNKRKSKSKEKHQHKSKSRKKRHKRHRSKSNSSTNESYYSHSKSTKKQLVDNEEEFYNKRKEQKEQIRQRMKFFEEQKKIFEQNSKNPLNMSGAGMLSMGGFMMSNFNNLNKQENNSSTSKTNNIQTYQNYKNQQEFLQFQMKQLSFNMPKQNLHFKWNNEDNDKEDNNNQPNQNKGIIVTFETIQEYLTILQTIQQNPYQIMNKISQDKLQSIFLFFSDYLEIVQFESEEGKNQKQEFRFLTKEKLFEMFKNIKQQQPKCRKEMIEIEYQEKALKLSEKGQKLKQIISNIIENVQKTMFDNQEVRHDNNELTIKLFKQHQKQTEQDSQTENGNVSINNNNNILKNNRNPATQFQQQNFLSMAGFENEKLNISNNLENQNINYLNNVKESPIPIAKNLDKINNNSGSSLENYQGLIQPPNPVKQQQDINYNEIGQQQHQSPILAKQQDLQQIINANEKPNIDQNQIQKQFGFSSSNNPMFNTLQLQLQQHSQQAQSLIQLNQQKLQQEQVDLEEGQIDTSDQNSSNKMNLQRNVQQQYKYKKNIIVSQPRVALRSLENFCDCIQANYLSTWAISFSTFQDNLTLIGLLHYPIFVYSQSSLLQAELDIAILEGNGLQGKQLSFVRQIFDKTNKDQDCNEMEPCMKIPLTKQIKLRKNNIYTLAISNITQECIDENNQLYFCAGEQIQYAEKPLPPNFENNQNGQKNEEQIIQQHPIQFHQTDNTCVQYYKIDEENGMSSSLLLEDEQFEGFIQNLVLQESIQIPVQNSQNVENNRNQQLQFQNQKYKEKENVIPFEQKNKYWKYKRDNFPNSNNYYQSNFSSYNINDQKERDFTFKEQQQFEQGQQCQIKQLNIVQS